MDEQCCGNCVFALAVRNAGPGVFVCVSRPDSLGEPILVCGEACCSRFQAKPAPAAHPCDLSDPPDDQTALIPLTQHKVALVDRADFDWLSRHKWYAARIGRRFYACRHERGHTILMHREILRAPKGMIVDHIRSDTLDNRRSRLRLCSQAQNRYNSRPHGGRCPFKGVYPQGDKWYGVVEHKGKQHYVGTFLDPVEAARARDRQAIRLFGEFAWLNFPNEIRIVSLSGTIRIRVRIAARLTIIHHGVTEHTETDEPPTGN